MLAADPCSLLDVVAPDQGARFRELAADHDGQGGAATDDSRCEARLALTLEARGVLTPTVVRPRWGEARDGLGQIWDFKAPHSRAAIVQRIRQKASISGRPEPAIPASPFPGEFDVQTEVERLVGQQQLEKGVVFDLRRLTVPDARSLIAAVEADPRVVPALVRFFPAAGDLAAFDEGLDDGN